ncbi:MAG: hypothetical protein ACKVU2_09880 [Saprospiraceae bacterium]
MKSMQQSALTLIAFFLLFLANNLAAQTTWTGSYNSDWNVHINWTNGMPSYEDDVIIPDVANDPVLADIRSVKSIKVNAGAKLTIATNGSLRTFVPVAVGQTTSTFFNLGTVINMGKIDIGVSNSAGETGFGNNGSLFNKPGATLTINRATQYGLDNTGNVYNEGKIVLGSLASPAPRAVLNKITSLFHNKAGGTINIDRSTVTGIQNEGPFKNDGTLAIGTVASAGNTGFSNIGDGDVENNGTMTIDRTINSGIFNSNPFTNKGTIKIGTIAPLTGVAIFNKKPVSGNCQFVNAHCAVMVLNGLLTNQNVFINEGFLAVNAPIDDVLNTAPVLNRGVIEYPQGTPIANVTNEDVIVAPVSGGSTRVNPVLQIGDKNSFIAAATWYKDKALTQVAGTYNTASNTFTPTNLVGPGPHQLYFSIQRNVGPCPKTVSIKVTLQNN